MKYAEAQYDVRIIKWGPDDYQALVWTVRDEKPTVIKGTLSEVLEQTNIAVEDAA